jgi:BirA family biotin operon repressor/biotin-[acetyl-CoA-carboxylase] ligase
MQQAEFEKAVAGLPLAKAAYYTTIGSTNDVIAEWARAGATGISVAAADEQTAGRGRAGRRWITPAGSALAFSLLLELAPSFEQGLMGRASGMGGLAVAEALEGYGLKPQIKWPNDVLLDGKKVCGVLPEAHWSGEHLQALILGIGINVASESVPGDEALNFPATSVEAAVGKRVQAATLLRAVLERLLYWQPRLSSPEFIAAWEQRLAYIGKRVRLETGDGVIMEADMHGLAADGGLKLRFHDGNLRAFQAGEIQLRPLVGDK